MHLLIFLLDAFRYDYVDAEATPFIHELTERGSCCRLTSLLGFSLGIQLSIWTGVYQETHSRWTEFIRSEKVPSRMSHSQLRVSNNLVTSVIKSAAVWGSARLGIRLSLMPGMPWTASGLFQRVPYYRPGDSDVCVPTLFDILSQSKVSYKYNHVEGSKFPVVGSSPSPSPLVDVTFADYLDHVGHKYGPRSRKLRNALGVVDGYVKRAVESARRKHSDLEVLIFSDHGITEIERLLDIQQLIKSMKYEWGRDYVAFYDSTFARFWFQNEAAGNGITEALGNVQAGRILTRRDHEELKLRLRDRNKLGDLVFLANPGVYIYPNFFHSSLRGYFRAMHGYDPNHAAENGFVAYSGARALKCCPVPSVVDLLPTILEILGLDKLQTCQGKSLVD